MTAAAFIMLALLVYTYVGYPVAIGLAARIAPRRSRRGPATDHPPPMVSVCLPVYNGATDLPAKLESLLAQDYPSDRVEILVYCDGCSDATEEVARQWAAAPRARGRIRVIVEPKRLGKPTGMNALVALASGELLLLNDVRQPLSPNALSTLAAALTDPAVGCVTGNLVLAGKAGSGVYWRYENWIRRQESRFRGVVGMTGPIAMIRRRDLKPLPWDLILDDVWIPMQLALTGKPVELVAEAEARDAAFGDDREFRRKVRTLAGNYQLIARLPALLVPFVNPIWFETFSHKIMRLLAPWLLLGLAGISLAGAGGGGSGFFRGGLAVAQTGFYGLAAVGPRAGKVGSVARTFVVLNAAAIIGLWRYLTGRQRVTW